VGRDLAACERDELIEGTISQRVKGGLSVTIRGGVKAFLPGSQVDLRPIRNLDKLIGQTFEFKVIKFNKKRGNIVLSRRVLLEKERDELKARRSRTSTEGMVVKGVIKNITEYGAFVDLGGIDGLLHITDMSWGRVNHPSEVFKVGDEVTVKVLKYNAETERVSSASSRPGRSVEPRRRALPGRARRSAARSCRSPTTAPSSSSSRASRASSTSAR
jgi:small subunit ribosomal protein S1